MTTLPKNFLVPQGFSLNEVELGRKLRMVPEGHARFETVYVDTLTFDLPAGD